MLLDIFVVEQQGFSYEKYKHSILFVHAFSWLIMGLKITNSSIIAPELALGVCIP